MSNHPVIPGVKLVVGIPQEAFYAVFSPLGCFGDFIHYPLGDVVLQARQVLEGLLGLLDVRHSLESSLRPSRSRASAADTVSSRLARPE